MTPASYGGVPGPSPRVRGSPEPDDTEPISCGSIPAGAGEPGGLGTGERGDRVHPRGCGGAMIGRGEIFASAGPSPRVRGSLVMLSMYPPWVRSIPAGAGEPGDAVHVSTLGQVHPRGCGGAALVPARPGAAWGPSPRVRGSPRTVKTQDIAARSIPAGAGEPTKSIDLSEVMTVHPRGCGGAAETLRRRCHAEGPSPRVRGSRDRVDLFRDLNRSIPAGAGEPLRRPLRGSIEWVHPRGCGGAKLAPRTIRHVYGPSPRVRGSHLASLNPANAVGSIPAGAGEPSAQTLPRCIGWVHPRGCGGADALLEAVSAEQGPSPRVRGSHLGRSSGDR